MDDHSDTHLSDILNSYFQSYSDMISICRHFVRFSWDMFDVNDLSRIIKTYADFPRNPNQYKNCREMVSYIERELLNNNEHYSEKLYNLVSLRTANIEQEINDINFINEDDSLKNKRLDVLRVQSGFVMLFITEYLDLPVNVQMNFTLGKFHQYLKLNFDNDKELLDRIFRLKKLNIDSGHTSVNIDEPLPEYEYKTAAQKIAWLYEIGIIETVIQLCKDGDFNNYRKTANVIHSFTGIHLDTIRRCIEAIYKPNSVNEKNNPLTNPDNKLFVRDMFGKFKISK